MRLTTQMNILSTMSRETVGAAFMVTCNKSGIWQVHFFNAKKKVTNVDIEQCIDDAIELLTTLRKQDMQEPKFRL